jgi:tetratricopeptide (TPR) repeat protein
MGRVNQAVDYGTAATTSDSGRAEYWHRLGLAYVGGDRWRDAGGALERALLLAPWDVRLINDLVQTQLVLGRDGDSIARARALQLADDGVRRDPNYPPIHFTRAVVMQFTGNVPEAIRSIERAFALDPNSRNAQWYIVATQLYVAAGRPADGVRVARQGLGIAGSARSALQLRIELARALVAGGQAKDALVEVNNVLAVEPGNAAAQRLRSEIQLAMPR